MPSGNKRHSVTVRLRTQIPFFGSRTPNAELDLGECASLCEVVFLKLPLHRTLKTKYQDNVHSNHQSECPGQGKVNGEQCLQSGLQS